MTQISSVLVTGGTGNIGSAVVQELLKYNYSVSVLCRSEQSAVKVKALGANVIYGDIKKTELWIQCLGEFDALIHTACTFEDDMAEVDSHFSQALANAAKLRSTPLILLYTTGCWNFGEHALRVTEHSKKNVLKDFKWMEDNGHYLKKQTNLDVRFVSPVNVVDNQQGNVPPILMWELERHQQPCIPNIDKLTWSLVDRHNLSELYRLVLEKGITGEEYIGSGSDHLVVELAQSLSPLETKTLALSDWLETYGSWSAGYGIKQVFSSEKAIKNLGWKPQAICLIPIPIII